MPRHSPCALFSLTELPTAFTASLNVNHMVLSAIVVFRTHSLRYRYCFYPNFLSWVLQLTSFAVSLFNFQGTNARSVSRFRNSKRSPLLEAIWCFASLRFCTWLVSRAPHHRFRLCFFANCVQLQAGWRAQCGQVHFRRFVPGSHVLAFIALAFHALPGFGGLKWTRTTDLTLIRRAL